MCPDPVNFGTPLANMMSVRNGLGHADQPTELTAKGKKDFQMSQDVQTQTRSAEESVTQLIAYKTGVADSMIGLYSDFESVLLELFGTGPCDHNRVITGGIVTPEVQLAIDKAGKSCTETVGASPFSSDIDALLAAISSSSETIFVSNPNRISGADWSISDLEEIVQAIPDGLLIVDEFYHDYYGISADPLLTKYTNIVVLRSPAPALGLPGNCGYLLASPYQIERLRQARTLGISADLDLTLLTECVYDIEKLYNRLRTLHQEALRMMGELARLGFQCRLTPFDRLIVKVASPAPAGDLLASWKVPVENLDGYPGLKTHIRIVIAGPDKNDRTLEAFQLLAQSGITSRRQPRRTLELKRMAEKSELDALVLPPARNERLSAYVIDDSETEKTVSR